ncbi:hypothetical protein OCO53_26135 [Peribacillus frigoritolerans]|nr:hypothetical protein [Peribacillus frigoritolerans]MCU6603923.1 hypothetical protein [Peribacillus frigoritolerans]
MGLSIQQVTEILQEVEFDLVLIEGVVPTGTRWENYKVIDPKI